MSYKYILIDLDRTLWDIDSNSRNALRKTIAALTPEIDSEAFFIPYEKHNQPLWDLYEQGVIDKETLRVERIHKPLNYFGEYSRELASDFSTLFLENMTKEKDLMPNVEIMLEHLKRKGCRISVVTNGFKEVQDRKLRNSGIRQYFESLIISEEVGYHKPAPEIYEIAIRSLGGTKEESLMIGDNFDTDIQGAIDCGIDQNYYNYKRKECSGRPTYMVADLKEILDIV